MTVRTFSMGTCKARKDARETGGERWQMQWQAHSRLGERRAPNLS